jgi:hypothetical protein
MIDLGRGCARHRPVLIDFVDRGDVRAETGAALAHLDRCARCTEIIESTMLTITALRRMGEEAAGAEPEADAWPRLQIRIQSWPRRRVTMSPLAGLAMSFAIVAVLMVPLRLAGGGLLGAAASPTADRYTAPTLAERRIEAAYLVFSRMPPTADVAVVTGSVPRNLPQEILQVRKEVHSAKPSGRPTEPI